jgi:hypothetical protein
MHEMRGAYTDWRLPTCFVQEEHGLFTVAVSSQAFAETSAGTSAAPTVLIQIASTARNCEQPALEEMKRDKAGH